MMGTCSADQETDCNEIVRKELTGHLDTPGMGIMQSYMYEWCDLTQIFD